MLWYTIDPRPNYMKLHIYIVKEPDKDTLESILIVKLEELTLDR